MVGLLTGPFLRKIRPNHKNRLNSSRQRSFGNAGDNFFVGRPTAGFAVTTRLAVTTAAPGTSGAARHVVCVMLVFTAT